MGTNNRSKLRVVLSGAAVLAAGAHVLAPAFIPDAVTLGLLLLAIVPWLSPIIESIDVPGVGRLELQVTVMPRFRSRSDRSPIGWGRRCLGPTRA